MKKAYLYDSATRRYLRVQDCQICPISGVDLMPPNALTVAPPTSRSNGLVYTAEHDTWHFDLAASVERNLRSIDEQHSALLLKLTGNPPPGEIATWDGKVLMAQAILAGEPLTPSQRAFLKSSNTEDADAVAYAQTVLEKSGRYWALVGMVDKLRATCRARVKAAVDAATLDQALIDNAHDFTQATRR